MFDIKKQKIKFLLFFGTSRNSKVLTWQYILLIHNQTSLGNSSFVDISIHRCINIIKILINEKYKQYIRTEQICALLFS